MVVAIARTLENGRIFAQGIACPMVATAYFLARKMHAPDSPVSYTVGNSFGHSDGSLSLTVYERLTLGRSLTKWSFPQVVTELLPSLPVTEWFRPAQVDPHGNLNNLAIGPYHNPQVRLPGCGGIADVTTYFDDFSLYVPRHTPRVFVPQVDVISGVGFPGGQGAAARRASGILSPGPKRVVTDLCVLVFAQGHMVVQSIHPGVTREQVQAATGFPVTIPAAVAETVPPTAEELYLIREEIDPLGIRDLEWLPRKPRQQRLWEIVRAEAAKNGQRIQEQARGD